MLVKLCVAMTVADEISIRWWPEKLILRQKSSYFGLFYNTCEFSKSSYLVPRDLRITTSAPSTKCQQQKSFLKKIHFKSFHNLVFIKKQQKNYWNLTKEQFPIDCCKLFRGEWYLRKSSRNEIFLRNLLIDQVLWVNSKCFFFCEDSSQA